MRQKDGRQIEWNRNSKEIRNSGERKRREEKEQAAGEKEKQRLEVRKGGE